MKKKVFWYQVSILALILLCVGLSISLDREERLHKRAFDRICEMNEEIVDLKQRLNEEKMKNNPELRKMIESYASYKLIERNEQD